jgi:HEAT repeat protein
MMRTSRLCAWLALLLSWTACSDADDQIRASVTLAVNHEGALASAAIEHLQRYGRRALPTIEAALHTAPVPGRLNLMVALRRIGDAEAIPLLRQRALYDPSPEVQREALWTLKQWAADSAQPARGERARTAVRQVEEERQRQEAG